MSNNKNQAQAPIDTTDPVVGVPLDRSKEHKPSHACGCGCGEWAKRGSHFLQGHDQRLKGMLQRVIKAKAFEGEPAAVAALLKRGHPGLSSSTFAPLVRDAKAALAKREAATKTA